MNRMRAKFFVTEKREVAQGQNLGAAGVHIKMSPVQSVPNKDALSGGDDALFGKYTPSGELNFFTTNLEAAAKLRIGVSYYLDFTEAPRD